MMLSIEYLCKLLLVKDWSNSVILETKLHTEESDSESIIKISLSNLTLTQFNSFRKSSYFSLDNKLRRFQ